MRKHLGAPLVLGTVGSLVWSICWVHRITAPRRSFRARTGSKKCHCTEGKRESELTNCTEGNGECGAEAGMGRSIPEPVQLPEASLPSILPLQHSVHSPRAYKPSVNSTQASFSFLKSMEAFQLDFW